MDTEIAPAPRDRSRVRAWLRSALFILGCLALVLTSAGFIGSWWRNPEVMDRGPAAQIGLLAALIFGLTRLAARGRLVPPEGPSRLLYNLQGQAVLWTTFLLLSTGQTGGKAVFIYLGGLGILTLTNPITAWEDCGTVLPRKSAWVVRFLAAIAAFLWVMSGLNSAR